MVIKINPEHPEIELIEQAALSLKNGNLVIFPTDTVYGLGVNGFDSEAVRRLFAIKRRDWTKPFALLIGEAKDVYKYCKNIPPLFFTLAERFWPGAMTVVLDAQDGRVTDIPVCAPRNTGATAVISDAQDGRGTDISVCAPRNTGATTVISDAPDGRGMDILVCAPRNTGATAVILDTQNGRATDISVCDYVLPREIMGTDSSVALRMPSSLIALALLRVSGLPIAASSANFSGGSDPAEIDEIDEGLQDEAALVIDGGKCPGVPSTVVDLRAGRIKILREGAIPAEEIMSLTSQTHQTGFRRLQDE